MNGMNLMNEINLTNGMNLMNGMNGRNGPKITVYFVARLLKLQSASLKDKILNDAVVAYHST